MESFIEVVKSSIGSRKMTIPKDELLDLIKVATNILNNTEDNVVASTFRVKSLKTKPSVWFGSSCTRRPECLKRIKQVEKVK